MPVDRSTCADPLAVVPAATSACKAVTKFPQSSIVHINVAYTEIFTDKRIHLEFALKYSRQKIRVGRQLKILANIDDSEAE